MSTIQPIIAIPEVLPICRACPSDWEVKDHLGREVYIRFRWGTLRVTVVDNPDRPPEELFVLKHGHPLDGIMSMEEMIELTKAVIDWRAHRIHYPS